MCRYQCRHSIDTDRIICKMLKLNMSLSYEKFFLQTEDAFCHHLLYSGGLDRRKLFYTNIVIQFNFWYMI